MAKTTKKNKIDLTEVIETLAEVNLNEGLLYITDVEKFAKKETAEFNQIIKLLKEQSIDVYIIEGENNPKIYEVEEAEEIDVKELEESDEPIDVIKDFESLESTLKTNDPVRMYLKEIGDIPLLNGEQELAVARTILAGQIAKKEYDELDLENPENAMKIEELQGIMFEGKEAKDTLVNANLRLVVSIAKKHVNKGLQFLDLIQEGNIGLMKATDKFDSTKGFKFSTYATWWIRQAITRAIADQGRIVRIPVHMVEQINKVVRLQRKMTQENKVEPTIAELAAEMGVSEEKIRVIKKISQDPVSLESPVGEEEDSTLGDFIPDNSSLNPDEYTKKEMLKQELDKVLSTLTDREEQVLRMRYGLNDGKTHTLEEVGEVFGVTRERIRQIEFKAIRKIKQPTKSKKLLEYLND